MLIACGRATVDGEGQRNKAMLDGVDEKRASTIEEALRPWVVWAAGKWPLGREMSGHASH